MSKTELKKLEILTALFKSKDGLTWNETSEMLNQLIDQSKPEWNKIGDGLPDEYETVWAYDQDNNYIYLACMVYTEGQWWWAISNSELWVDNGKITAEADIVDIDDYNITHWQPLPKLPKKQKL